MLIVGYQTINFENLDENILLTVEYLFLSLRIILLINEIRCKIK